MMKRIETTNTKIQTQNVSQEMKKKDMAKDLVATAVAALARILGWRGGGDGGERETRQDHPKTR
jgi:hypothetical protein